MGHSPELNHVSRTSVSWVMLTDPQCSQAVGVSRATVIFLQSAQCHAGIRWPHQSCREMHQSRMFSIQFRYVFSQTSGTNSILFGADVTASMAASARGLIFTHHCVDTRGST